MPDREAARPSRPSDADRVRTALLEIAAYLASAASISLDEPPSYGNLRLLEGVQRTLDAIVELDLADDELASVAADLDLRVHHAPADPEGSRELADRLAGVIAARLQGD
jgi:hypothetical protein